LNELIGATHEKDELLDSQEEFLIKENKKHVKIKNTYAQEVEKCENLTSELSTCHDTISNLRFENANLIAKVEKLNVCDDSLTNLKNDNANLIAKIDKLNESLSSLKIENDKLIAKAKGLNVCNDVVSNLRNENAILHAKIDELNVCKPYTSTVNHVSICTRCRDINVDAIHDHIAMIKQQNDHIAKLDAKIAEHELENENFKFAHSMICNGRRPGIKDGIGFQQGDNVKPNAPKRLSNFVKGKAPMHRITRVTFYILLVILSIKLGEFILGSLILALIMLLCIRMRHIVLGILPMLKCLKRNLLLHQINPMFHLTLLMLLMCLLTNPVK
jgi:hypothetical protein